MTITAIVFDSTHLTATVDGRVCDIAAKATVILAGGCYLQPHDPHDEAWADVLNAEDVEEPVLRACTHAPLVELAARHFLWCNARLTDREMIAPVLSPAAATAALADHQDAIRGFLASA